MNVTKTLIFQQFLSVLKLTLPFLLWVFMFRDFIFGRIPVNMDTNTIYSVTKFYFNNLLNGVVPLWDPFVLLGTPFYAITICNLFNPITQLVIVLKVLGMNYYDAFMAYIVIYYFIGALGFYCLAKALFKDRRAAYIGYLLFLFSGIGASMFNQFTIVELFVPAVWFFVFLTRFIRNFRRSDFLGLCYSSMIVMISYLPFYFATLLGCFIVLTAVLFFKQLGPVIYQVMCFLRQHILLAVVCVLGILTACAPLIVYKFIDSSQDVVSPGRHCAYTDVAGCYERTMNEEGGMSYKETSQSGGLAERVDLRGLFVNLDRVSYGTDQFFFIPLIAFIFILLAVFLSADKILALLISLGAILTLVGFADVSGVHRFLYNHIFFFKYFRNLFFFEAYIIPIIILLAVGALNRLSHLKLGDFSSKKAMVFWTVVTHGALFMFLARQDGMIRTALLTVGISLFLFLAVFFGLLRNGSRLFWASLSLIVILQPFEVYRHYALNAREFQCDLPKAHVLPEFSWTRPTQEVKSSCKIFKFVHYETFYDSMAMKDSRGYIGFPASVTRGAFLLSQWMGQDTLINFTQHKLMLLDNVRVFDESPLEVRSLSSVFNGQKNVAYVNGPQDESRAAFTAEDWGEGQAELLAGPSDQLKVSHFDVNSLKLTAELSTKKFLVYTDSYTKHWKAFLNGREEKIARTYGAFKGLWLPAGQSQVEFRYSPPGGGFVYLLVTIVLLGFCGATLIVLWKEKNWLWNGEQV